MVDRAQETAARSTRPTAAEALAGAGPCRCLHAALRSPVRGYPGLRTSSRISRASFRVPDGVSFSTGSGPTSSPKTSLVIDSRDHCLTFLLPWAAHPSLEALSPNGHGHELCQP